MAVLAFLLLLLLVSRSLSSSARTKELRSEDYKISLEDKKIDVVLKEGVKPVPGTLYVKIKKDEQFLDRVQLRLIDISSSGVPHFSGQYDFRNQPYIGLQFTVELGEKK